MARVLEAWVRISKVIFLRIKIRLKELEHNFEFVSVLAKKALKY